MRMTPYFELDGNRYEFKRTRWLIAEHKRLEEENPLSNEDKATATKAYNLIADAKMYADKAKEKWDIFCETPTIENRETYRMFKELYDEAVEKSNRYAAENNAIENSFKHRLDIFEIIVVKALAEQYFGYNEALAKQTWEKLIESDERFDKEKWLMAFAECLFGEDENEEETGFLAQKRKADEQRANNRKNAIRNKR